MGISRAFYGSLTQEAFYGGAGTSLLVPGVFPVSLNGHQYIIDLSQPFYRQYRRQVAPILRTQADTSTIPGEQSIDPEGLWRRSQESWHLGAGQNYLDRKDSDPSRFRSSKGIAPWTKWQISLLNDTRLSTASANTNLYLEAAGTYLYKTDGTALSYTQDITVASPTWTAVTGGTQAYTSLTGDGFNIWVARGSDGVYTTTRSAATQTQQVTSALAANAIVGYVKGRLMVANNASLYNVTAAGPAVLPTALFTSNNSDFTWVGFAEGPGQIYAAGFSGNKSLIYRTAVVTDGSALAPPVVAGELPSGEIVRSIRGYLGYLLIGSDLGVRFSTVNSNGDLVIGALIPTPNGVYCFEPQDRFVWFGWTNYDGTSTGLGRVDLLNFTSTLTPAYASDLMYTGQGRVTSVKTFQSLRVFAVSGAGIVSERTDQLVSSASLDSGFILYGLNDKKVGITLNVQIATPMAGGTEKSYVSSDGGAFAIVGTQSASPPPSGVEYPVGQVSALRFEVRTELDRDGSTLTAGPVVNRYTLRAQPAPKRPLVWQLPVVLDESTITASGAAEYFDPLAELVFLEGLAQSGQLVNYQEGSTSQSVFVEDVEWLPHAIVSNPDRHWWNGIALVKLKGVPPS